MRFWVGIGGQVGSEKGAKTILGSLADHLGASWGCPGHLGGLWTLSWVPKSDLKSVPESFFLWIPFLISFRIDF